MRAAWRALWIGVCVFVESVDRGPGRSQRASTGVGLSGVRRSAAPPLRSRGARTSQELLAIKQQFVSRCGL